MFAAGLVYGSGLKVAGGSLGRRSQVEDVAGSRRSQQLPKDGAEQSSVAESSKSPNNGRGSEQPRPGGNRGPMSSEVEARPRSQPGRRGDYAMPPKDWARRTMVVRANARRSEL
ncbi:chorismate mutase [Striga asiatica]|uniref:Chorismate mutase n=1 Tax=Striga asiatica TaxID=4170 RepID=A0A5A7RDM2_STRAF|nr:chorismate mutase [Striga asiatica]